MVSGEDRLYCTGTCTCLIKRFELINYVMPINKQEELATNNPQFVSLFVLVKIDRIGLIFL